MAGRGDETTVALLKEHSGGGMDSARDYKFTWNQRTCFGRILHRAVVEENVEEVRDLIDTGQSSVFDRFVYESKFEGVSQAGSGEAIHLAATHGHVSIVKSLLERRARLEAKVTRGAHDHYDVLHAAVFGQGRGGSADLVKLLLEKRAPFTLNANKHTALHVAFLTGRPDLIKIVRHAAIEQGNVDMGEDDDPCESQESCTPLELGIASGKMTVESLAQSAPMSPVSLHVFTRVGTDCIFPFLERCIAQGIRTNVLAKLLSFQDLTNVIRENPAAAGALLEKLTSTPTEENPAWHPLPYRVSFAPKGLTEQIRYSHVLNPPPSCLTFYTPDNKWKYDNAQFKHPPWHSSLTAHAQVKPGTRLKPGWRRQGVRDVDIRVCHVPNLACPEIFAALGLNKSKEELEIFSTSVVKGLISHVWLQGACRVDLLQGVLSLYCLLMIVLEQIMGLQSFGDERRLSHIGVRGHTTEETPVTADLDMDWGADGWDPIPISMNLIGARGVVQLVLELLTLAGYISISPNRLFSLGEYLDLGSLYSIFQCLVQIGCLWDPNNIQLRVMVIFLCWGSLLRTCTAFEKIACELIPLTQCAYGLIPSAVLTLIFFLASFHALFNLRKAQSMGMLGELFLETFAMLFTGALPTDTHMDAMVTAFTYTVVLVFSVFFLNIFIGVIIEQYQEKKGSVAHTYQQVRCHHCLTFLLQTRFLPTQMLSKRASAVVTMLMWILIIAVQVMGLMRGELITGSRPLFVLCLACMMLSFYQDQNNPWINTGGSPEAQPRYLWIVVPKEKSTELPKELQEMHNDIREILMRTRFEGSLERQKSWSQTTGRSPGSRPTLRRSRTEALADFDRGLWSEIGETRSEAPSHWG